MNDEHIESMLDDHAWPDMPGSTRNRLDVALRAHERGRRSQLPALAAGLLKGKLIGGSAGYVFAPLSHGVTPMDPSGSTDAGLRLVDPVHETRTRPVDDRTHERLDLLRRLRAETPEGTDGPTTRLVVNTAVFSAPTINPESHVARWSAIGPGRGPTP